MDVYFKRADFGLNAVPAKRVRFITTRPCEIGLWMADCAPIKINHCATGPVLPGIERQWQKNV